MTLLLKGELRSKLEADLSAALDTRWATAATAAPEGDHAGALPVLSEDDAVVHAAQIVPVAHYLRDTLGYAFLSNITVIDYPALNMMELLYQFYNIVDGGPDVRVRVRVGRTPETCVVPSLTPTWPGANLQEREAYDMYGVVFPGHPNLARIYMWDEFKGFPMRKDFPKTGDKYTHVTGE